MKKCVLCCFEFITLLKMKKRETLPIPGRVNLFPCPLAYPPQAAKLRPNRDMDCARGLAGLHTAHLSRPREELSYMRNLISAALPRTVPAPTSIMLDKASRATERQGGARIIYRPSAIFLEGPTRQVHRVLPYRATWLHCANISPDVIGRIRL